jgi:hypothetical protein
MVQTSDEGLKLTVAVTASNALGAGPPATSSSVLVAVPKVKGCPAATGKLSGTTLGLVRLGMTRAQARRSYTRSSNRGTHYEDFFCLTPIGVRVGYGSSRLPEGDRDKVIWASTSSAFYAIDGIRVGATVSTATKALKLTGPLKVGLNTWYLAPEGSANAVLKTRSGLIEEIGIADKSLTGSATADKTFLRSFS